MENTNNPITDATDAAKSLMKPNDDGVFKQFGNNKLVGGPQEFLNSNTLVAKVVFILLVLIIFIFLMRVAVTLLHKLFGPKDNPVIKKGRFNGNFPDEISTKPGNKNAKPILRSNNQDMGMEFTYSTWIYFNDDNFTSYNAGDIKHIFNKGNRESLASNDDNAALLSGMMSINGPGLYLDGNTNKLHIAMQTFEGDDVIQVPDIPMKKWINVIIRLENRNIDIYINGTIVVRHELQHVAKQNYGNIFISQNDGFSGEQSSLRYFNKALTSMEIHRLVQKGPNMSSGGVSSPFPPYLSTRWFFNK
jgi:hypothetical protein